MSENFGEPPSQFHLTRTGSSLAEELIAGHWFGSQTAAAKFGFAVALREGVEIASLNDLEELGSTHGGSTHSLSAVDPDYEMDRVLRALIEECKTATRKENYITIMKLSDKGLSLLHSKFIAGHKLSDFID